MGSFRALNLILVAGTSDEGRLKAYKSQLRLAQKELKAFVDDHSAILRRDYSREKAYGGKYLTNERNKRILKEKIANDKITLVLNTEKQNPHIIGSSEYNSNDNKSYFDISFDELQQIVDENYATGDILMKSNGQIKEVISLSKDIGTVIDEKGKVAGKTNRITIHYSKKRTHCVPAERRENNKP